jgi:hypothetical protein
MQAVDPEPFGEKGNVRSLRAADRTSFLQRGKADTRCRKKYVGRLRRSA